MKNRALLSAFALCFLAAACDSKKATEPPQPKTAAVVPLPPPAPTAPAASAKQDAPAQMAQAPQNAPTGKAGAPAKSNGRKGCTKDNCKVQIDVTGGKPCAKASIDPINVYKDNKGDDIHWKVNTNRWKFASNGIEWKDSNQQQFKDGDHENNDQKTFKWKDLNTDDQQYHYKIHLVKDDGTKCDVDPSAINGADEVGQ